MRRLIAAVALSLLGCTASEDVADQRAPAESTLAVPAGTEERWRAIKTEIHREFPEVEQLGVDAFAERMNRGDALLLVDVRARDEFAVSHIPGAVHIAEGRDFLAGFADVPRDREIVLYCSVGWRSSRAARELRRAGYQQVRNLEGSIFEWANKGHALEGETGAATRVHPFNSVWGQLLHEQLRASR